MRRRLRLLALAISAISIAAFLVPLVLSLQRHQRTAALAAASQTATEVASLAAVLGDDQTRVQNYFLSAYAGSPYGVTIWYSDGRSLALSPQGGRPGEMPTELRYAFSSAVGILNVRGAVAGGYRLLVRGPGPVLATPSTADVTPVVEVFVPTSELTRGMRSHYVSFGIVAVVIVLGSLVLADRVAAMRPPSSPSTPEPALEPAPA